MNNARPNISNMKQNVGKINYFETTTSYNEEVIEKSIPWAGMNY